MINNQLPSSFRDPSSFVYSKNNSIYRDIRPEYKNEFDFLLESGLYKELTEKNYLISHSFISQNDDGSITIKPEEIPFVSYPYEWSFEQIKDAALLTLKIQNIALNYNMSIKDASIYNIQFKNGKPIFIDTTSFEPFEAKPWKAYYQFCKHFLYPLWAMYYISPKLNGLYTTNLDGLEPNLTKSLLPFFTNFKLSVILHLLIPIFYNKKNTFKKAASVSKEKQKRVLKHLFSTISRLNLPKQKSTWNQYYDKNITKPEYLTAKESIIKGIFSKISPGIVVDLGANDGHFSKLIYNATYIISTDFDSYVVNDLYVDIRKSNRENILPLIINVSNPSPGIGWNNEERSAFFERKEFDTIMALALIHHLVFSENISLDMIAKKFSLVKKFLIIEFIPKDDDKVIQITHNRETGHLLYSEEAFEKSFNCYFNVLEKHNILHSERIIYLYERKT